VLDQARLRVLDVRVDIVSVYPGCDATALDALAAAGAQGIVLEASGAGNANLTICAAVARLTGQGVVVVLSTRVHAGPVVALYGGGGGVDLVAAGALPAGLLRPSQARILLIALLGTGAEPDEVRSAFVDAIDQPTPAAGRRPSPTHWC
jgi:L-asparaginase